MLIAVCPPSLKSTLWHSLRETAPSWTPSLCRSLPTGQCDEARLSHRVVPRTVWPLEFAPRTVFGSTTRAR
jgi:hypothetical protein